MSGVRSDDRDRFDQLPRTLQAKYHRDYRSSYKEVLHNIVSHVCTDPKKPDYLHVELTVEGIAGECRLTPRAVFAAIKWLEEHGYLLREHRRGQRSVFWVVLCSKEIQEWRQRDHDQAVAHYRSWVTKRRDRLHAGTHGVNSSSSPGVNQSSGRTPVHPIRERTTEIGRSIQDETAGLNPPAPPPPLEDHQDDGKSNGKESSDTDREEIRALASTLRPEMKRMIGWGTK